jgi:hypothetical protein
MRPQFEYRIMAVKTIANLTCPSPLPAKDTVLLGHGSGGTLSGELVRELFLPAFHNAALDRLDDQAILNINGSRLAFTTDSFVVKPSSSPEGILALSLSTARSMTSPWVERSRCF